MVALKPQLPVLGSDTLQEPRLNDPEGRSNFYRDMLQRVDHCHGGIGHVHVFRPFERAPGSPQVDFMDLAVVPPGSEIGRHRHGDNEEWYIILRGTATMYLDGRTFPVNAGDIVVNQPFGEHGLVNDSDDDVHLFVFQQSRSIANAP